MNQRLVGQACLVCSVAFHAATFAGHSGEPAAPARRATPSVVELSVAPPPLEEPAPQPAPPPPPPPPPEPKPSPPKPVEPPAAEPAPATPSEAAPELTGTTLTSDRGDGWRAPEGSGSASQGAIRAGLSRPVDARVREQTIAKGPPGPPAAPEATPLAQLSKKPVPPPLTAALERNYPPQARRQGQSGEAKVRARVEASGKIQRTAIVLESSSGFGDACRRTLIESKWSAPLDQHGRPVATWITYRCRFRIDD